MLLYKDVVLFAGGDRKMSAYDLASGELLWSAPHAQSGYQSPEDLMVSGGLVWSAPTTRTADSGIFVGRDPRTGEVKSEFSPVLNSLTRRPRTGISTTGFVAAASTASCRRTA
jgi:outer membrane protein assembly factor BamB